MRLVIDGLDLDVLDRGAGPALVLLHPFGVRKELWEPILGDLAARARVVAIDLRGMGESAAPPGPYLVESLAGDVAGVIEALGIERAVLVGHSYSCAIAYETYRMYEHRIAALAVIGASAQAPNADASRYLDGWADEIERDGDLRAVLARAETMLGATARRERPELLANVEAMLRRGSVAGDVATLRGLAMRAGAEDLLAEIAVPFLAIAGDEDELASAEAIAADAARVPGGRLVTLRECGHVPQLEAPAGLRDALLGLVAES